MSHPSPSDPRPRRREDVVFRRVAGDWLLFDPQTRRIHVLNLSAALVWSFCTGEHDVDEIAREVEAAFGGDGAGSAPEASDPVGDVLRRFRAEGLLEE